MYLYILISYFKIDKQIRHLRSGFSELQLVNPMIDRNPIMESHDGTNYQCPITIPLGVYVKTLVIFSR